MPKPTKKTTIPSFKMSRLKKVLIQSRYIQFSDINFLFNLNTQQEKLVLSLIMKSFWESHFNLFQIPNLCELGKYINPKQGKKGNEDRFNDEAHLINREHFRSILLPSGLSNHHMYKGKLINFNSFGEFEDGDESLYEPFIARNWDFYERKKKKLERKFCKIVKDNRHLPVFLLEINETYSKFGKPVCECEYPFNPSTVTEKMEDDCFALTFFTSLCIEYRDLINLLLNENPNSLFSETDLRYMQKSMDAKDSKHDRELIKSGYFSTDEYIFDRYLEIYQQQPPGKSERAIVELLLLQNDLTRFKKPARNRVLGIIQNQKRERIKKSHFLCPAQEPNRSQYINDLANSLFTQSSFVEKVYGELGGYWEEDISGDVSISPGLTLRKKKII